MAKGKGGGGMHELKSGLIHLADSLAGGVRGTFVDRFGPPGDPTVKTKPGSDSGIVGGVGKLGTRWMRGGKSK